MGRNRHAKRSSSQPEDVPKPKMKRQSHSQPEQRSAKGGKKSQAGNEASSSSSQVPITSYFSKNAPRTATDLQELANSAAFYIAVGGSTKLPITRAEIMKTVLANQNSKCYGSVLEKAAELLMEVFGLQVVPIDDKPLEKSDKFILVNGITSSKCYLEQENFDNKAHQVLLCLILNCIHMSGGTMLEEQMLEFLSYLQIKPQDTANAAFGNVAAKLSAYKAQQYLKYEVNKEHNPPVNQVVWGPRAHVEASKQEMFSFIKEVYPEVPNSGILNMTIQGGDESEDEDDDGEEEEEEDDEEEDASD